MAKKDSQSQETINATQGITIEGIVKTLDTLTVSVEKGFEGVHTRQDTANGRTSKNENDLAMLKQKFLYDKVIWYLLTISISACGVLITFILLGK